MAVALHSPSVFQGWHGFSSADLTWKRLNSLAGLRSSCLLRLEPHSWDSSVLRVSGWNDEKPDRIASPRWGPGLLFICEIIINVRLLLSNETRKLLLSVLPREDFKRFQFVLPHAALRRKLSNTPCLHPHGRIAYKSPSSSSSALIREGKPEKKNPLNKPSRSWHRTSDLWAEGGGCVCVYINTRRWTYMVPGVPGGCWVRS